MGPRLGLIHGGVSDGQSHLGVAQGPSFLLKQGLKQKLSPYTGPMNSFSALARNPYVALYQTTRSCLGNGYQPLILGGDHSLSVSTVPALKERHGEELQVVWVDAHGDINTPSSSPSGHFHGMPLAALLGLFKGSEHKKKLHWLQKPWLRPEDLHYLGLRDLDPSEKQTLQELPINLYDLGEWSLFRHRVGLRPLHISFDVDVMDPTVFPHTGVPVAGGWSLETTQLFFQQIAHMNVVSLEVVEFNPELHVHPEASAKIIIDLLQLFYETRWKLQTKPQHSLSF